MGHTDVDLLTTEHEVKIPALSLQKTERQGQGTRLVHREIGPNT